MAESFTGVEPIRDASVPAMLRQGQGPSATEAAALYLTAAAALLVLMVALLVLAGGPTESKETLAWVLAFAVAIPAGLWVASRQRAALDRAAPAATARALAIGVGLLAAAFCLRRFGTGTAGLHAVIAVAACGSLAAPFLAARLWRESTAADTTAERCLVVAFLAAIAVVFVPERALGASELLPALALAAGLLGLLWLRPLSLPRPLRLAIDALACLLIAAVVVQLPELGTYTANIVHHQGFFLGPANDVLHGHAMLNEAWSQYGVGLLDALGIFFEAVPIGFGTMSLLTIALTVAQMVCVYAIVRLAGAGLVLGLAIIAVAIAANLFYTLEAYFAFPSAGPLRFGLPYLIVLFAVAGLRFPRLLTATRAGTLLVLAIAAAWSFETLVYSAATYAALTLVGTIAAGTEVLPRLLRRLALGAAACLAGVIALTLITLILQGQSDWGPYFEYLRAYSAGELSSLPIEFFSAGPLMAAAIFLSAASLLWLALNRPRQLSPPLSAALTGFTGLALATFTYYLGRSHPNNLLVLLTPVVAFGGLWLQALANARLAHWRLVGAAAISLALAMVAVASWPSVTAKRGTTALARVADGSLRAAYQAMANNPPLDPRAPLGVEMLARYLPPGAPALVLSEPDLSTEVLMRADRRNLLPISHAPEDVLIDSSFARVRAAAEKVPAGSVMLTSPVEVPANEATGPTGMSRELNLLQREALAVLHRRFEFQPLLTSAETELELVRLRPREPGG